MRYDGTGTTGPAPWGGEECLFPPIVLSKNKAVPLHNKQVCERVADQQQPDPGYQQAADVTHTPTESGLKAPFDSLTRRIGTSQCDVA